MELLKLVASLKEMVPAFISFFKMKSHSTILLLAAARIAGVISSNTAQPH